MSAEFDPYYKWLGIAAEEQPASLYRLLGVRAFEADSDVIDTAADQRMRLLKSFETGPHAALSEKLISEVLQARQRLLDPAERVTYDAELKKQTAKPQERRSRSKNKQPKWPEGQQPTSIEEFLQCLAASGIMTREEAHEAFDEIPADKEPHDPKTLAKLWLSAGRLTVYQAGCLLLGKLKYLAFGEYLILEKLGQGGMGQVLKAEHRRMKRLVALKLISGDSLKNPDSVRRFQREVQASARLIHPNIVTAFDANEHEGMHYYVMEFVDGPDLGAVVKKSGQLPVERAVNCVLQAARGLAYAHSKGIVHRDMKPSNLLIDKDGTVKILDMGLARLDLSEDAFELTNAGQILGTADYMAPEQALDTHSADGRADIYSLGCTLYRLLTAQPLYTRDTLMQKLLAHREAPIPSLRASRPEVPEAVDDVFQRLVAKRPQDRPQTMPEVVAELEALEVGASRQSALAAAWSSENNELSTFLNTISERGSSTNLSNASLSRQGNTALAVSVEEKTSLLNKATEATKEIKSGDTDRLPVQLAAKPGTSKSFTDSSARPKSAAKPRHRSISKPPAWLVPVSTVAMLALLAASISLILNATTLSPAPPPKEAQHPAATNSPQPLPPVQMPDQALEPRPSEPAPPVVQPPAVNPEPATSAEPAIDETSLKARPRGKQGKKKKATQP